MLLGRVPVILDEVHVEILVRDDVAIEVHAHEARQLQEARIDVAREAGLRPRHLHDDVVAEPVDPLFLRQLVDGGRVAARVDRPAHQRHRSRREAVATRLHDRYGGERRHRWLANRHHMRVRAEMVQHVDDVVDIVVEVEPPVSDRHHAGVRPVRDVDFGMLDHRLDRAAQERRVVTGHRRDDQQLRVGLAVPRQIALEMDQVAERLLPDHTLAHRHLVEADLGLRDTEGRFAVAPRRALKHFRSGRDRAPHGRVRHRIERIGIEQLHRVGEGARRLQRGMVQFVELIIHGLAPRASAGDLPDRSGLLSLCCNESSSHLLHCNRA